MLEKRLEYWKQVYLLNAKSKEYKRKVMASKMIIETFLKENPYSYVAFSCGKDSLVTLMLALEIEEEIDIKYIHDDTKFSGILEYINELRKKYKINIEVIEPNFSVYQYLIDNNVNILELYKNIKQVSKDCFYSVIKKFQCKYDGVLLGLRKEESRVRLLNFAKRGYEYCNKTQNINICVPVSNWTSIDVMSYIYSNRVPMFDIYTKIRFREDNAPHNIRMGSFIPYPFPNKGFLTWLKFYYPEEFRKLEGLNPNVRGGA